MSVNIKEIIKRMMQTTKTKNQEELARVLGVSAAAVSKAITRGSIPSKWYTYLLNTQHINPEWLKTGSGSQPPLVTPKEPVNDLPPEEFWRLFNEIMVDPVWRGWYQVELTKRFPELLEQMTEKRQKLINAQP